MTLPETFQFSQTNLQDYVDCARRFQLRHLLRQPWPAVASEPLDEYERLVERGQRFHRLAERHNLGVPEATLTRSIDDDDLRRWWRNYLESPPPNLPTAVRRPEVTLSAPLGGYRLTVARYDLLAVEPGQRAVIVDWKTSLRRPDSAALAARLQTRIYRYVLVEAGTALNGGLPLSPEQITMIYWFAEHPANPEILPYDSAQYTADAAELASLVADIAAHAEGAEEVWPLTPDERRCRFCTYRSLCRRGVLPGPLTEFDVDAAIEISLDFDFEEIEEIEY
jgi:CRISPR/Cas system-associated exonuclease Cas4 (RecB family)